MDKGCVSPGLSPHNTTQKHSTHSQSESFTTDILSCSKIDHVVKNTRTVAVLEFFISQQVSRRNAILRCESVCTGAAVGAARADMSRMNTKREPGSRRLKRTNLHLDHGEGPFNTH